MLHNCTGCREHIHLLIVSLRGSICTGQKSNSSTELGPSVSDRAHLLAHKLYCIAGNFCMVQKFMIFVDRTASAKIKTAKIATGAISIAPCLPVRADATKFLRMPSEAILRNFAPTKISQYTIYSPHHSTEFAQDEVLPKTHTCICVGCMYIATLL